MKQYKWLPAKQENVHLTKISVPETKSYPKVFSKMHIIFLIK